MADLHPAEARPRCSPCRMNYQIFPSQVVAAREIGVHPSTIYRAVEEGRTFVRPRGRKRADGARPAELKILRRLINAGGEFVDRDDLAAAGAEGRGVPGRASAVGAHISYLRRRIEAAGMDRAAIEISDSGDYRVRTDALAALRAEFFGVEA